MPNSKAPTRTKTAAFTFTMLLLKDVDTFPLASGPPASHSWYTCFAGLLYGYWPVPPPLADLPFLWGAAINRLGKCIGGTIPAVLTGGGSSGLDWCERLCVFY